MRITHRIARPARTLFLGSLVAFIAAPSFGGPGDRIGRYPLLVTEPSEEVVGPSLAMEESGRFIAVWASDEGWDTHVYFQRFAPDGARIGDKVRVGTLSDLNDDAWISPSVALAGDGSFAVVWQACTFPCGAAALYARRYTANGEPIGDAVEVYDQRSVVIGSSAVAAAADGRFVVAWYGADSDSISGPRSIFVRLFSAAGVPQSPPVPVVQEPTLDQVLFEGLEMSATGNFLLVWEDRTHSTSTQLLLGRRFDANGSALGGTFTLASSSATTPRIGGSAIAMRSTGEFVLALTKSTATPAAGTVPTGIYGRRFDAEGRPLGAEFLISAAESGNLSGPGLVSNRAGDFVVTWHDSGLHTRLYRASGSAATSAQRYSELGGGVGGVDRAGNFLVAFSRGVSRDDGGFGGSLTMHVQRFAGYTDTRPSCARFVATVVGNDKANSLHGGPDHDIIVASGGNDTVFAWGGDDVVCGNNGADVLYGGHGKDHLVGGSGDDLLDGGPGSGDYCNGEGHTNADTAVSCEFTDRVP